MRCLFWLGTISMLACVGPPGLEPEAEPLPRLWRAPLPPDDQAVLRMEPTSLAVRFGQPARLRVEGSAAAEAECLSSHRPLGPGPEIEVPSPVRPAAIDVMCSHGELNAHAQVTFVDAEISVSDPYAGGVALFKLRRLKRFLDEPVGTRRLGLPTLDEKLGALGAWALPAFPFDLRGLRDYVGLDHWIAVDIPPRTNFYQAVSLLRRDPEIHPESYLPQDASFLRVEAKSDWPAALQPVTRLAGAPIMGGTRHRHVMDFEPGDDVSWDLKAIGAPDAWKRGQGSGVRLAVVDTGVDVNHAAIAPNLVARTSERLGDDVDGNGVPGDESGTNLAHLAIAHAPDDPNAWGRRVEPPRLALGLLRDVSDWEEGNGHGTAIASVAAGAGGAGGRLGAAPRAEILVVDVQENLRTSASRLSGEDPRMRDSRSDAPLHSSVWSRAAGIAYAIAENARVVTCAWADAKPHWLLHDALMYAEDNCAIPVCAASPQGSYPAAWRREAPDTRDVATATDTGTGAVYDAWTGALTDDFYRRPLRATLIVAADDSSAARPDLVAPRGQRPLVGAISTPRNDSAPTPDRRTARLDRTTAATGLVAGAAILVTALRPDLEPWAVRESLVPADSPARSLDLPAALDRARRHPEGPCESILSRQELPKVAKPWWKRVKIKAKMRQPGEGAPPASRDRRN